MNKERVRAKSVIYRNIYQKTQRRYDSIQQQLKKIDLKIYVEDPDFVKQMKDAREILDSQSNVYNTKVFSGTLTKKNDGYLQIIIQMIQSSSINRSEQLIYQRRQQEQQVSKLATKLRQENYEKTFANWENKGKDVAQNQYINQRLKQLREDAQSRKNERKEKLSQLLAYEHEQYKQEILAMVETPEQVKERMIKQVQELKARKEAERSKFADSQNERRFREQADELRQVNLNFNELQAVAYRNMQMIEKQKLLEDQYEEEMIYAELYKREIQKKERLEREKEIIQKQKLDERNQVVAVQQQLNHQNKQKTQQEIEQEKAMLRQEWQKDNERFKQAQNQYNQYKKEVHHEIAINNEQQKQFKQQQKQVEKIEDKEMVKQVLEREEAQARMEHAERQRQKEETRQFLLNFKNRTNEYSANDQLKEKLINEENQRQWEAREAVWKKEDDARVKLMYEVYDQRANNLDVKKQRRNQAEEDKAKEKEELLRQMALYEQELEERRKQEQEKILKTKQNLLNQMDEKQMRQQMLRDRKIAEEEALQKQKQEYEKKIELEKAKGRQLMNQENKDHIDIFISLEINPLFSQFSQQFYPVFNSCI
ncbi:hypothetical protein pb186bvf_012132 [Paramecium bursaria]